MAASDIPALDEYWKQLEAHLPGFSADGRRAAIALYRELAKGEVLDDGQLGRALGISPARGRALLQQDAIRRLTYRDGHGRIAGFGGLAAAPMHHRFEVDGRALWTWCAWDSLFIPEILGRPARVTSRDPESGEVVRLVVTPDRIESADPEGAVMSFIRRDAEVFATSAANVMAKFCHFVFVFASRASGERWIANHPGTFLYSLDDAFALAKRFNVRNFGAELSARTTAGGSPAKPLAHGRISAQARS